MKFFPLMLLMWWMNKNKADRIQRCEMVVESGTKSSETIGNWIPECRLNEGQYIFGEINVTRRSDLNEDIRADTSAFLAQCSDAAGNIVVNTSSTGSLKRFNDDGSIYRSIIPFIISQSHIDGGMSLNCSVTGCYRTDDLYSQEQPLLCQIVPPSLASSNGNSFQEINGGQELNLTALITESTFPTNISWSWPGMAISGDEDRVNIYTNTSSLQVGATTFQLSSVLPKDSGSYGVTAFSEIGNDTLIFNINITVGVNLTYPGLDNLTKMEKEGSSITLLCVARGAPEPSITWYNPDGDVVNIHFVKASNNTEVDEEGFISVTSMLNIPNLLRNNSGTYTCSASNIVMEETVLMNRTYSLTVIYAVDLIDPLEDKALTVEEGTSTTLQCTAEGFPVPTITWYNPDGNVINPTLTFGTDQFGDRVINVTSTLSISNLQRNHSGRYTCSVIDETVVVNRTLTLKVNSRSRIKIFLISSLPSILGVIIIVAVLYIFAYTFCELKRSRTVKRLIKTRRNPLPRYEEKFVNPIEPDVYASKFKSYDEDSIFDPLSALDDHTTCIGYVKKPQDDDKSDPYSSNFSLSNQPNDEYSFSGSITKVPYGTDSETLDHSSASCQSQAIHQNINGSFLEELEDTYVCDPIDLPSSPLSPNICTFPPLNLDSTPYSINSSSYVHL